MDAPAPGGAPNRPGYHRRPARVLVVDDEPLLVRIVGRLLSVVHRVHITTSAKDALRRILSGERYNIVFCDVMMPEMNGVEFYEKVAQTNPAQARRIVFITGGVTDPALRTRLTSKEVPVLEKPVDIRLMQRLADEYLEMPAAQAAASE